jgi:hypothetical protein
MLQAGDSLPSLMLLLLLLLLLLAGWGAAGSAQPAGVLRTPEGHAPGSAGRVQLCRCAARKCKWKGMRCMTGSFRRCLHTGLGMVQQQRT